MFKCNNCGSEDFKAYINYVEFNEDGNILGNGGTLDDEIDYVECISCGEKDSKMGGGGLMMIKWKTQKEITREEAIQFFNKYFNDMDLDYSYIDKHLKKVRGNYVLSAYRGNEYTLTNFYIIDFGNEQTIFEPWFINFWIDRGYKVCDFQGEYKYSKKK